MRTNDKDSDFNLLYTASRAWVRGIDPYDPVKLDRVYRDAGGTYETGRTCGGPIPCRGREALIYPPSTLLCYSPISVLPWPVARIVWPWLNTLFFAVSVALVLFIAGIKPLGTLGLLFQCAALVFAPVHACIWLGQSALVVFMLLMGAYGMKSMRRDEASGRVSLQASQTFVQVLPGVLIGLATAIKPQIGGVFLLYELWRRRWTSGIAAVVTAGMAGGVGAARLYFANLDWWSAWQGNVNLFVTAGEGRASMDNLNRHQLTHLDTLFYALTDNATAVRGLTLATCGLLALAYFLPMRKHDNPLLTLGMLGLLSLLAVYHRSYDAVLLLPILAWCLGEMLVKRSVMPWIIGLLLMPIMFSSVSILYRLAEQHGWFVSASQTWWWKNLVMQQQAWVLLLLAVALIVAKKQESKI